MRLHIIPLLALFSLSVQAQDKKAFREADYPANTFEVFRDSMRFREFTLELIHVEPYSGKQFSCRAWLVVRKGRQVIDRLYFSRLESDRDMNGLFFPDEQPDSNHFILSKFGDYDGQTIVVSKDGKIQKVKGGIFYVSDNRKYLFSVYDSDLSGISVFDLEKNKPLLFLDSIRKGLEYMYEDSNYYYITISQSNGPIDSTPVFRFNPRTGRCIETIIPDTQRLAAKQLPMHNYLYGYSRCRCGRRERLLDNGF